MVNRWLVNYGKSTGIHCPGHEADVAYVKEKTREMAAYWAEKREEERLQRRAARQQSEKQHMQEEKEQSRVQREQRELARLIHNRNIREERLKRKRRQTLERSQKKKSTWEAPSIRRLGNSALLTKIAVRAGERSDTNKPPSKEVGVSLASSQLSSRETGISFTTIHTRGKIEMANNEESQNTHNTHSGESNLASKQYKKNKSLQATTPTTPQKRESAYGRNRWIEDAALVVAIHADVQEGGHPHLASVLLDADFRDARAILRAIGPDHRKSVERKAIRRIASGDCPGTDPDVFIQYLHKFRAGPSGGEKGSETESKYHQRRRQVRVSNFRINS